ncbi:thiazole synthase [Desulfobulbus oligotrophicus]|jgi:thiazole synthase|uniref:Thiazole synthase n=1 Tax=Desulfobulbus oligotrophicus TaxID=1909699 RepID=A0A7T5VEG9_9BACT|nr:thiazole synthase [Desulfobulbus oligotrophicus]MDY0391735.1 thiazole synthase [Desulfobulbus oligotrophicus]QQG66403.1 thiazole synthase [Desulfobulbus oligotrophicus]
MAKVCLPDDSLQLGPIRFTNRLFTGTGKFAANNQIPEMLAASGSEMITVALRRVDLLSPSENILDCIPKNVTLLPNTSGARTAEQAVRIARIAREAGCGDFIKIEVITDMKYLMPDNWETLQATETLANEGFVVLPYVLPDLPLAKRLENAGAAAVMPLGAPIGSNRGLETKTLLALLIENCTVPIVVDAGLGRPSHAAAAMEMGADAVLVNTAIATARDPVAMGQAFDLAVKAGRTAYLAELAEQSAMARPSSPLTGFLDE